MRSILVTLLVLLVATGALAQGAFAPGDVLVGPAAGRADALRDRLAAEGLSIAEQDRFSGVLRVRVPVGSEREWVARIGKWPGAAYAETNGIGEGGVIPNDTWFGSQWHLRNTGQSSGTPGADIRADAAWDVTTGAPNVVIAVLDTGIDFNHPEFAGRIDPDGYDFVNNDNDPTADHPHGSQVAGVMCANANNSFSIAGVDWQCKVLPLKVLDRFNAGTVMWLAAALNYVATQNDVRVVSMSLINYPASQTLANAMQAARNAGQILISCAGNGGIGNANVSWPGASPLTISIGATTHTDSRAFFSGTGAPLDFVAPGENVVTLLHNSLQNGTTPVSGCSFATPITAGVVGLLLARAQALNLPPLDQQQVYDLLRAGARDQVGPPSEDTPGRDDYFGHGRIDARSSVDAVSGLASCANGNVGMGLGGPYDVLRVQGMARAQGSRTIEVALGLPFQFGIDVPPSNPQPSAALPFFVLAARFGDLTAGQPFPLPLGIGDLCFDPTPPNAFFTVAGFAPWSTTVPAQLTQQTFALQGIVIDRPQGTFALTNGVTVAIRPLPPPVISSVLPAAALVGTQVTIRGSGFEPGLTLRIQGSPVATTSITPDAVTFSAPGALTCNAPLVLTNPDQQTATSAFNVPPVIVNAVGVGGLPSAGGTRLLITGQNFLAGSTVTIGGTPMQITSIALNVIDGMLPPGSPGPAAIVVSTPLGCTGNGTLTYGP